MKPQQRIQRERMFGPVPEMVTHRLTYTLNHLEEEPPMKKRAIPLLAIVLVLVLAGMAYAAMTRGLEWYYETRVDYGGRLPQDVEQRIQYDLRQGGDGNPLANVSITSAAWLGKGLDIDNPDSEVLDINIRATVKDPNKYEMVHGSAIDTDGVRGEEERRVEHPEYADRADEPWLWAYGTRGPLDKVMKDPAKQLLLFGRVAEGDLWIDGSMDTPLPIASYDLLLDNETGEVVVNYTLRFDDAALSELREHADKDGFVTLVYQSWVEFFKDRAYEPEGETGVTTFRIMLPK